MEFEPLELEEDVEVDVEDLLPLVPELLLELELELELFSLLSRFSLVLVLILLLFVELLFWFARLELREFASSPNSPLPCWLGSVGAGPSLLEVPDSVAKFCSRPFPKFSLLSLVTFFLLVFVLLLLSYGSLISNGAIFIPDQMSKMAKTNDAKSMPGIKIIVGILLKKSEIKTFSLYKFFGNFIIFPAMPFLTAILLDCYIVVLHVNNIFQQYSN